MDELNLIKNILSLNGKCDPNLKKTISMLETMKKINKNGMDEDSIYSLLTCMNPKITPLLNIIKSEYKKENKQDNKNKDDFVQYNHPDF